MQIVPSVVSNSDTTIPAAPADVYQSSADTFYNIEVDKTKVPFDTERYFDAWEIPPEKVTERWRQIGTFGFDTTTAVGTVQSFEPISALFGGPAPNNLKDYSKYYKYYQSDVEVRVTVAPTPAVSGLITINRSNYLSNTPSYNRNASSYDPYSVFMQLGSPCSFKRCLVGKMLVLSWLQMLSPTVPSARCKSSSKLLLSPRLLLLLLFNL